MNTIIYTTEAAMTIVAFNSTCGGNGYTEKKFYK